MGVVRLRLARFGSRNRPFYRVVAIDSRKARDSQPIENIGTYDPLPYALDGSKEVRLKVDRIKYWLSVGAQPSDRVAYLLWRAGMLPAPPIHYLPDLQLGKSKKEVKEAEKAGGSSGGGAGKKGFHTMTDAVLERLGGGSRLSLTPAASQIPAFSGLLRRTGSNSLVARMAGLR